MEVALEIKRLTPYAPIIMLSGAVDIPKKALKVVDAFVTKDRLGSQLLPMTAGLQKGGFMPTRSPLSDKVKLVSEPCNLAEPCPGRALTGSERESSYNSLLPNAFQTGSVLDFPERAI